MSAHEADSFWLARKRGPDHRPALMLLDYVSGYRHPRTYAWERQVIGDEWKRHSRTVFHSR